MESRLIGRGFMLKASAFLLHVLVSIAASPVSVFETWLHEQRIPVPRAKYSLFKKKIDSLPLVESKVLGPVRNGIEHFFEIRLAGGNCSGIRIGSTNVHDLHEPGKVRVQIVGFEFSCSLHLSRPGLQIDFALADTTVVFDVAVSRYTLSDGSQMPLGSINLDGCDADIKFSEHEISRWTGDSVALPDANSGKPLPDNLFQLGGATGWALNSLASLITCRSITMIVNHAGKGFLSRVAGAASEIVEDKTHVAPAPIQPLLDWGAYPPINFVASLLSERMEKLVDTDTVKALLHFGTSAALTRIGHAARLDFGNVQVHGAVTPHLPRVVLQGAGQSMNLWVDIKQLEVKAALGLTLTPMESWIEAIQDEPTPSESPLLLDPMALKELMNISVRVDNISLALRWLHMAAQPMLNNLEVDQMQSLKCMTQCSSEAAATPNKSVFVERFGFEAFPRILQAGAYGSLEDNLINTIVKTFMLLLTESGPALSSLSRGAINGLLERLLSETPECPPSSVYYGIPAFTTMSFWLGILCLIAGMCLFVLGCVKPFDLWGHARVNSRGQSLRGVQVSRSQDSSDDDDNGACFDLLESALFRHPKVPLSLSLSYPFFLVATFLLFLYGDFSLGTTLQVVFSARGQQTIIGPIFSFSLVSIIKDAYRAGAWLFALLAAGMSGVWPLAKLVLLLVCWFAPTSILSIGNRGLILTFLDQYGKFSLIDIWLGVIGLASYNMQWQGQDGASIKVQPVVLDGFFVFIVATAVSLVLGHVGAICHKRTEYTGSGFATPNGSDVESTEGNKKFNSMSWTCFIIFLLLLLPVIILQGTFVDSFYMVTGGMAAEMLTEPWERLTYFSTITLGSKLVLGDPQAAGLVWIQWFVYFFTIILPVVLAGLLMTLWLLRVARPQKKSLHAFLLTCCRILDAWSALDVFAVAVLVSALEIEIFARYMVLYDNIHTGCMWVKENLHTNCLDCGCRLAPGFAFLALAGLLSYALPKMIFCWVSDDATSSRTVHPSEPSSPTSPSSSLCREDSVWERQTLKRFA